ncbi:hypothetical protein BD770DRAFT_404074, partial [Pilaira anomala]
SLGEHGLIVKKYDGEIIKAKVHLVMVTGDIPQFLRSQNSATTRDIWLNPDA